MPEIKGKPSRSFYMDKTGRYRSFSPYLSVSYPQKFCKLCTKQKMLFYCAKISSIGEPHPPDAKNHI